MRKKLFTFLLALVTSVGLSWATVITWDASKVSSMAMNVSSGSDSRTSDGITVTAVSTGEFVVFGDHGGAIEIGNGEGSGGGYLTFTSSVGNIAQIDIYHSGAGEWRNANGDWISPYYENFEGGIFTWSGTPAASITLTGDAPRHIDGITSIEFTIEDGGGSTPATGLQVVEVTSDIYNGWNSNGNTFSVNALPGFQAVTFDEAKAWTEVPTSGTAVLVYRTNGEYARVIHFFDGNITGDYDIETDFNQIYENITIFGNRFFYTAGGGSTPDPTPTTSGSCGANVTWEFDPSTGALTITGTGAMDDYLNNASTPWNSYIADITSVTITDGVTNVGNHSFEQCTSLTTVTIGDDVETIGTFAFSECGDQFTTLTLGNSIRTIGNQAFASNRGITGFTLPSTLETIGNYAFIHNNAITTLTIPSNVTSIDVDAFYDWKAVTDVYCYPNAADLTWDDGDCDDFKSGKATICHVNADQLDAYQTKFNDLVRVTFVGDLDAPAPVGDVNIFNNSYECTRSPYYPTKDNACEVFNFENEAAGPWKVEFLENYDRNNTAYANPEDLWSVLGNYYNSVPGFWEEDAFWAFVDEHPVPVFTLSQWDGAEYQFVSYGLVLTYANPSNAAEHAAVFRAANGSFRYLTDNTHGGYDDFNITFDSDLTDGLQDLVPEPSVPTDQEIADAVIALINAIPNPVAYNDECKNAIDEARAEYDALTDAQKALVANYGTLLDAETAYAQLTPHPHGECGAQGDNLLWDLNPSTGVLTITGSGAMYDWVSDTDRPWYSLRAQITSVVLPSGITSLGKYAFRGTDIVSINMTENYPAGLTAINQEAFFSTQLTSITIPESVVTIGMDAFRESKTITDVYCYADPNNLTWNDYYCDDFKNADHATVCHVKACALETYEANWGGTPYNVYNSTGVNVTFVGDLPGDCGAPTPTPTDEEVPTNADPENPSYHYSTFFHSTQNYKLSNDGTQAFIADLSNNELVLTEIAHGEQVIPANTAVILRKTGSADPVVLVPTAESGAIINPNDNSLEGVDDATLVTDITGLTLANCYVLSGTNEHGVGFYKINGNTLKAHKAYVKYAGSSSNAPKKMRFVYGQATGIEDVQGNNVQSTKVIENGVLYIIRDGKTYNAMGQMVK